MSEIVNLRLARKRKARADAERESAARRAQFGRTKAELRVETERRARDARTLDGHRRDGADEP